VAAPPRLPTSAPGDVAGAWDQLGRENALGAILSKSGELDTWNLSDFLATGRADVDRFMADLRRIAPDTPQTRALDFGCGVGRITRALADHFDEVVGVDAAPSMIDRARTLHADDQRCRFVLNHTANLRVFPSASFSVVYSRIVLQHIRPVYIERYVPEFIRVLSPGGVLMFQLPEAGTPEAFENAPVAGGLKRHVPRALVVLWRRLKFRRLAANAGTAIEMFGIPRPRVERLITRAGGRLLETTPDASHGDRGSGFAYWVTR